MFFNSGLHIRSNSFTSFFQVNNLSEISHSILHAHLMLEQGHTHTARAIMDEMEISFKQSMHEGYVRVIRGQSALIAENGSRQAGAGSSPADCTNSTSVKAKSEQSEGVAFNGSCPSKDTQPADIYFHMNMIEAD